jgi:low temperature requirement protein LtrA
VRILHLLLYVDASRRGGAALPAIGGFAGTVGIGIVLLVAGALTSGTARVVLWIAAAAIDYAGPVWIGRHRIRGLQRVAVAHLAERYGLFIIICLGESIFDVGTAVRSHLTAGAVTVVSIALLITIGLWWTYFDRAAGLARDALARSREPVLAASDGYSILHLPLVSGILVFAVGAKEAVTAFNQPLAADTRLALCGGIALYLVGHVAFLGRMLGSVEVAELAAAGVALALFALTASVSAVVVCALLLADLVGLIVYQTFAASGGTVTA